jgi:aldose sugar dehydrogenase
VLYNGHGGLLDVELDPDFEENHFLYPSYLKGSETASTMHVLRAKFDADHDVLADAHVLFEGSRDRPTAQSGGRLAVSDDGYLFLSLGDRWGPWQAQKISHTAGSIIRIKTDGTVPKDNPFVRARRAQPEIWSYGHRNPQGFAYDRATGQLWSDEHGPQGGDELNLIHRGGNYGWPVATFGVDYSGRSIS